MKECFLSFYIGLFLLGRIEYIFLHQMPALHDLWMHSCDLIVAIGFDGISSWLLKLIKPVLTKSLTLITNQILTTGIFPDKLKTAKVIPIYKKGDETIFCNYRPISILPVISKVIETIIYGQLDSFLKRHKLMYDSQYGFRKEHSTEFAALELIYTIKLAKPHQKNFK